MLPKWLRRDERAELRAGRFAGYAACAERAGKFFQTKNKVHLFAHQAFFAHRTGAAHRNAPAVHHDSESWLARLAKLLELRDSGGDAFAGWLGSVAPIGQKTVAEIFVNRAAVLLDDFLAAAK